jgi:hypothetical protein
VTGDQKVTWVGERISGDDDRADRSVCVTGLAQIEMGGARPRTAGPGRRCPGLL